MQSIIVPFTASPQIPPAIAHSEEEPLLAGTCPESYNSLREISPTIPVSKTLQRRIIPLLLLYPAIPPIRKENSGQNKLLS